MIGITRDQLRVLTEGLATIEDHASDGLNAKKPISRKHLTYLKHLKQISKLAKELREGLPDFDKAEDTDFEEGSSAYDNF